MQPNAYSINDGFFNQVATWRPKIGYIIFFTEFRNLEPIYCSSYCPSHASSTGFHQRDIILTSPYKDFGQSTVVVAMPHGPMFSHKYTYPDNSIVRTGADFWAAQYLSKALNFNLR